MKRQGKEKLRRSGQGRKEGKETGWKEDIRLCLTSPMTHIESDLLTLWPEILTWPQKWWPSVPLLVSSCTTSFTAQRSYASAVLRVVILSVCRAIFVGRVRGVQPPCTQRLRPLHMVKKCYEGSILSRPLVLHFMCGFDSNRCYSVCLLS